MNKEDKIRQTEANTKWEKRKYSSLILENYPNVLEISLDLQLDYPNAFSIHKNHFTPKFNPTDKAYFEISCINKDCLFSDLDLDNEIRNTINQKLDFFKGHKICNGYNTFSCYERKQGTCMTRLDYEIKIKYKNAL
ncbi:MAG: hypothetical protein PHP53_01115 [Prolixibacteraceae bacterium]|nr:hypothetical protein [Prolixibacteraceae bacterium]